MAFAYDTPIRNQRDKWEIDYVARIVPGKTLIRTPEEFLYWRSDNRNHVHAMSRHGFHCSCSRDVCAKECVPCGIAQMINLEEVLNFSGGGAVMSEIARFS